MCDSDFVFLSDLQPALFPFLLGRSGFIGGPLIDCGNGAEGVRHIRIEDFLLASPRPLLAHFDLDGRVSERRRIAASLQGESVRFQLHQLAGLLFYRLFFRLRLVKEGPNQVVVKLGLALQFQHCFLFASFGRLLKVSRLKVLRLYCKGALLGMV